MRYNGRTDTSTIAGRIRELGFERYADYLASPHWEDVRQRFYAVNPRQCACGSKAVALHHRTYERLGAERLEDLEAVCRKCHRDRHQVVPAKPKVLPSKKLKQRRQRRPKMKRPAVVKASSKGYRRGEAKDGPSKLTFHP